MDAVRAGDRSFGRMALMTSGASFFARGLGVARNSALAAAIGTSTVADSYNVVNNIPNMLFFLLGGGTIAAVFVPLLVRHGSHSKERFDEFASILVVLGAGAGLVLAAALVALRSPLLTAWGGSAWSDPQRLLAEHLAVWCLPQVFFLVSTMMFTQLLNAKERFWAASWTPALNNISIIATCGVIAYLGGVTANDPDSLTPAQVVLLGTGTLVGSVLQSAALLWGCRRAGVTFRRPRGWRGYGLRQAASIGSMTFAVAVASQLCNIGIAILCTRAGATAAALGQDGRGYSTFFYAQSIVVAAQLVLTGGAAMILLQRLSKYYTEGKPDAAAATIGEVVLRASSILIPVGGLMAATAPWTVRLLFAHGQTGSEETAVLTLIFAIMSLALLPYGLQPILVRPFYANGDARTPLVGYLIVYSTYLTIGVVGYLVAPASAVVVLAASAFTFAYWIDLPLKVRRLRRAGLFALDGHMLKLLLLSVAGTALAGAAAVAAGRVGDAMLTSVELEGLLADLLTLAIAVVCFVVVHELVARGRETSLRSSLRWMR